MGGNGSDIPEVYAVDLSSQFYAGKTDLNTGYLAVQAQKYVNKVKLHLLTGDVLANRLDDIGGGIDFVLIDTVHSLPGEILDVIAVMPFLKEGAWMCFHDLITCQSDFLSKWGIATPCAFHTMQGEKYVNDKQIGDWDVECEFPNIGAIQIAEVTKNNMENVFAMLLLPWYYLPEEHELEAYGKLVRKYYSKECVRLFEDATKTNTNLIHKDSVRNRCLGVAKILLRGRL